MLHTERMKIDKAESFRKRETAMIVLSLGVIGALMLVHAIFLSLLGPPSLLLVLALALRFAMLLGELIWLRRLRSGVSLLLENGYAWYSILINILFASLASYLGGAADSHYSVLMVLPVIAAAARFNLPVTILIAGIAAGLTLLEVWLFFRSHPPAEFTEFFEAATVALIFMVGGLVVYLLVGNLRRDEARLAESLAALRKMQGKMVSEEKLSAVGRLSSAIAHEIRNPVAIISSSLETARQASEPGIRDEMFRIAIQEAARLEKLTADFLIYARGREPERRATNIRSLLGYVTGLFRERAAEAGIKIRLECRGEIEARLDDFQIQQALINLVSNAIEATPAGGKILVEAWLGEHDDLVLAVENEGSNIQPDVAERIFEPFFSTRRKGVGLGLAIVRNIVLSHQGQIDLAANEDGRVRFEVRIPGVASKGTTHGTDTGRR